MEGNSTVGHNLLSVVVLLEVEEGMDSASRIELVFPLDDKEVGGGGVLSVFSEQSFGDVHCCLHFVTYDRCLSRI